MKGWLLAGAVAAVVALGGCGGKTLEGDSSLSARPAAAPTAGGPAANDGPPVDTVDASAPPKRWVDPKIGAWHSTLDFTHAVVLEILEDKTYRWADSECGTERIGSGTWDNGFEGELFLRPDRASCDPWPIGPAEDAIQLEATETKEGLAIEHLGGANASPRELWERGRVCAVCGSGPRTPRACDVALTKTCRR